MLLATHGSRGMLVRTDNRAIHVVRIPVELPPCVTGSLKFLQHALPYSGGGPPPESAPCSWPWPESLRQVPPRRTGAKDPEDRAQNRAVIARGATRSRALWREKRSEALPLPVGYFKSFAPAVLPRFAHTA